MSIFALKTCINLYQEKSSNNVFTLKLINQLYYYETFFFNNVIINWQWDSSVHDVDYKSFDFMFWIEVKRVKRS